MDAFDKDEGSEPWVGEVKPKLPPSHIMKDYAAGVHLKIEARKRFLTFAVPIASVMVAGSALLILLAVLGHPHHGNPLQQAASARSVASSQNAAQPQGALSRHAHTVSAADISLEIKILRALGEDPTEAITGAMDADQLAKEMSYWDQVAAQLYKQTAPSAAVGKF